MTKCYAKFEKHLNYSDTCSNFGFKAYAADHPELIFQVTRIGCGLAGYKDEEIAPLFLGSGINCEFDSAWKSFLGAEFTYWGHYD